MTKLDMGYMEVIKSYFFHYFSVLFAPCSMLPQNHSAISRNRFSASENLWEPLGDQGKVLGDPRKVLGDPGKVYFPSVLQFFRGSLRILEIFDNFTCPY